MGSEGRTERLLRSISSDLDKKLLFQNLMTNGDIFQKGEKKKEELGRQSMSRNLENSQDLSEG